MSRLEQFSLYYEYSETLKDIKKQLKQRTIV